MNNEGIKHTFTDPLSILPLLRYANVLVGTKKGRWTQEEDELLLQQCKKHGEKWAVIARGLGGRTDGQCLKRIQILRK